MRSKINRGADTRFIGRFVRPAIRHGGDNIMEGVGLGLGAVSLLFQVFSGCIKGYQLLSEAKGLNEEHQFFRIRFKTEQYRLLDWATIAQLTATDEALAISTASKPILLDVLDQQHRLMLRFGRLDDRLRPLTNPLLSEEQYSGVSEDHLLGDIDSVQSRFPHTNALLQKSLAFVHSTSKYPTKLKWVISDKAKIEEILAKLTSLNNYLDQLLNNHQLQSLSTQQMRTNYQIMQLNDKVEHLTEFVKAGLFNLPAAAPIQFQLVASYPHPGEAGPRRDTGLVSLAQFKALMSAIETVSLTDDVKSELGLGESTKRHEPLEIPSEQIMLEEPASLSTNRVSAWYNNPLSSCFQVWIEWESEQPGVPQKPNGIKDHLTLSRFEALVELLRQDRAVAQFRTMRCLGYFVQEQSATKPRYGFIFQNPAGIDPGQTPTSLVELMAAKGIPSLSARVRLMRTLAECLEKLHAVNWLHKGLRGQSVVFFRESSGYVDLAKPYLSGFDYSRPKGSEDKPVSLPAAVAEDLYRHPAVKGVPRVDANGVGFKKQHDIYALGVLFLEIVYWQPIYAILGFDSAQVVSPEQIAGVRMRLLEGGYEPLIRKVMGDTVTDIIMACLNGPAAFGVMENAKGGDAESLAALKLQERFFEVTVKKLRTLAQEVCDHAKPPQQRPCYRVAPGSCTLIKPSA